MTIRNKIFIYNILILLFTIILMTGLVNIITSRAITDKAKNNTQTELELIKSNIDSIIHNVNNYIISFSIERDLQDLLKENPELPEDPADVYNTYNKALESYTKIRGLNEYIFSYEIYTQDFQSFDFSRYSEAEIKLEHLGDTLTPVWTGPYRLINSTTSSFEWIFLITKKTIDLNRGNHLGYVSFYMNENILGGIYDNLNKDQGEFHILDKTGNVISSSNKDYIGNDLNQAADLNNDQLEQLYDDKSGTFKIGNNTYFISIGNYERLDWRIVYSVPYDEISREKDLLIFTIVLIGFGCVFISFIVSYLISQNISRPIFTLANVMKSIRKGEMDVRFPVTSTNEVGTLGRGFNSLMDRIDELLKTVYSEQKQIRDYEFKLIQSQINPHFLYNSLGMIESLINIDEYEEAVSHVHYLTSFYRLSLSTGNDLITLKQEFEITKSYLEIQQRRYIEYISYEILLAEGTGQAIIPKLTLQPIVENAIYHGLKESKRKGVVRVRSSVDGNNLILSVYDSGRGIEQSKIDSLHKWEEKDSFGLSSIDKRIKLLYGDMYGISIKSEVDAYTEISLTLPFLRDEDALDA